MQASVISLEQVCVRRDGRRILDNVDLGLSPGEHCIMLGPNGAGKTTLLGVISGYLWPSSGAVSVLGERFGETDLHKLRRRIGLVSQASLKEISPFMSGLEVVYSGARGTLLLTEPPSAGQRERAGQLIEQFALAKVIDSRFGLLSAGERQRVLIARSLMNNPALLILDEPAAGMDMAGREGLLAYIEEFASTKNAATLLMVTHHISEIMPSFGKVLLLKDGAVLAFGEKALMLTAQNISRLYELQVKLDCKGGRFWPQVVG